MPQSALDAGLADFCLGAAEIGEELNRLAEHPFVAWRRPEPSALASSRNFHARTGFNSGGNARFNVFCFWHCALAPA